MSDATQTAHSARPLDEPPLANADLEEIAPPQQKSRLWIIRLVSVVLVVGSWEVLGRQVDPLFMSYPSAIAVAVSAKASATLALHCRSRR